KNDDPANRLRSFCCHPLELRSCVECVVEGGLAACRKRAHSGRDLRNTTRFSLAKVPPVSEVLEENRICAWPKHVSEELTRRFLLSSKCLAHRIASIHKQSNPQRRIRTGCKRRNRCNRMLVVIEGELVRRKIFQQLVPIFHGKRDAHFFHPPPDSRDGESRRCTTGRQGFGRGRRSQQQAGMQQRKKMVEHSGFREFDESSGWLGEGPISPSATVLSVLSHERGRVNYESLFFCTTFGVQYCSPLRHGRRSRLLCKPSLNGGF